MVAGVGNIYATEALFLAGIYPEAPVGQISLEQFASLCHHIKVILRAPLSSAGQTLRDFVSGSGKAGIFSRHCSSMAGEAMPNVDD